MAMYCARCGSFNSGPNQSCISCMGPMANGVSVPADARCASHPTTSPLGRCVGCGSAVCFECGSMVDQRVMCFNCAATAATTTATSAAGSGGGGRKKSAGLFKKK